MEWQVYILLGVVLLAYAISFGIIAGILTLLFLLIKYLWRKTKIMLIGENKNATQRNIKRPAK
jgi:hypothetical protein